MNTRNLITVASLLASLNYSLPTFGAVANTPLYLTANAPPNVLINLSVESPMGGAAYNDQNDTGSGGTCNGRVSYNDGAGNYTDYGGCYRPASTYIGYFDPNKCYTYDSSSTYTWGGSSYNGHFVPSSAVLNTNHECSGKWSGNFLNWVSMTAIDMFVKTMTGGNRVIDTVGSSAKTVVARARKQDNSSWFPYKIIGTGIGAGVSPSTVSPFGGSTLIIYNFSAIGIGVSTTQAGASGATTNGTNLFRTAVQVCSTSVGVEGNCTAYTDSSGNTYYKPEGLIQANAEKMRFSLTSYLFDSSQDRDGGVLRTNMKYVGPRKFNATNGSWITNTGGSTNREWYPQSDVNAGQLINNPDGASGSLNSGLLNYLNKFSEVGYKSYDPIGELYYESIRYFKHLGPTPSTYGADTANGRNLTAVSRSSSDNRNGGFWFYQAGEWEDPILFSCQKNFIIGINDANPWLDKRLPGTSFTTSTLNGTALIGHDWGEPSNPDTDINVTELTRKVGQAEGLHTTWQNSGTWTSTGSVSSVSGTWDSVGGDANNFDNSCSAKAVGNLGTVMGTCPSPGKQNSYYIAGLAYYANTTDLRLDISGTQSISTFIIDSQEYTTAPLDGPRNMLWLAGKYGGFIDQNNNKLPDVASEWDSDGDGYPDNYVLATNPDKMIAALTRSFADIETRTSSASAVSANSTRLDTDTLIYQVKFNSGNWSGQVIAYAQVTDPAQPNAFILAERWNTDTTVHIGNLAAANARKILTWNPDTKIGSVFDCDDTSMADTTSLPNNSTCWLTATQRGYLGSDQTSRIKILDYLRGDPSNEKTTSNSTGIFRDRLKTLGDIINSDPAYAGQGNYGYDALADADGGGATYATYRANNGTTRTKMLYVGGNDGMLHGLNADTGVELFAFVPNASFPKLQGLTSINFSHKYLVDGSPVVSDAYIGNTWKTYVVGNMGMGGRSVFALDVTDPSTVDKTSVKWEFDNTVSNELGYLFGKPSVVRMANGRWAAIFGNGFGGGSGSAKLFIVFLNPDLSDGWTLGTDYIVLNTNSTTSNGMGSPAVLVDTSYTATAIYAGDLQGNIWKFDVSSTNPNSWGSALQTGSTPKPLFTAKYPDNTGAPQPITAPLEIGSHSQGGYMIYFGTGKYFEDGDQNNRDIQTFYGIWDKLASNGSSSQITYNARTDALQQHSIIEEGLSGSDQYRWRIVSDPPPSNIYTSGAKRGWFIDLKLQSGVATGERVVSEPVLRNGRIIFVSLVPSTDPCSYGGYSWIMEMSAEDGSRLSYNVFDINGDGLFNVSDNRGSAANSVSGISPQSGIVKTPAVLSQGTKEKKCVSGSSGAMVECIDEKGSAKPRASWRQVQ